MNSHYLRRKLPRLYHFYLIITQRKADNNLIGERLSFGEENFDKVFFIIRLNNANLGLMAIRSCVLGYLRVADKQGFIPIVDLQNYENGYLEKEEVGKMNAWEYYFEQTSKYSLGEVYRSKNVVLASGVSPREASPTTFSLLLKNKKTAGSYYKIVNKYLRLKSEVQQRVDRECKSLIGGKRVLGVSSRGSDLLNLRGHSIQPNINDLIERTKNMLVEWNCEFVFLASEEEFIVEIFRKNFGEMLLVNESCRIGTFDTDNYLPFVDIRFNRANDKYLKGLEYLTTVIILSRCNCLIGSQVGKTLSALEINMDRYENKFIYDLGVY